MKRIVPPALFALAALVVLPTRSTPVASPVPVRFSAAGEGDGRMGLLVGPLRRGNLDAGRAGILDNQTPSIALAPAIPDVNRGEPSSDLLGVSLSRESAAQAQPDSARHPGERARTGDGTTPLPTAKATQASTTPTSESTAIAWVTPTGFRAVFRKGAEARQIYVGLIEPEHLEREEHCLAQAVYFEARSEMEEGRAAVAQVVLNRVKSGVYPTTVCGVVFQNRHRKLACQFTFACEGKPLRITEPEAWKAALRIARNVYESKIYLAEVGAATHYHADYVQPGWAKKLKKMDVIGRHVFYS